VQHHNHHDHCHPKKNSPDWVLWGSLIAIVLGFFCHFFWSDGPQWLVHGSATIVDLIIKMAWGLVFAIFFVGILDFVPREKISQILGSHKGLNGILRATIAGVVLDLCSHGILLIAMKLYERGISLGQMMAFLIASPWNSFSMTLILWSLIGLKLTLIFIILSCVIALLTGVIFDHLEKKEILPKNPNQTIPILNKNIPWLEFDPSLTVFQTTKKLILNSLIESKMILRWIFFGVLLTAIVKELLSPEQFKDYFGPDSVGILLTVIAATVMEVCSEGSSPLAAELVTTAQAPGNAFTFLMAGVSTDYTEIFSIKETTKSWKIALFLPLITLPQIIIIGILLNQ
jgi:uncharacterized protein